MRQVQGTVGLRAGVRYFTWESKKASWRKWHLSWPFNLGEMKLVQNGYNDGPRGGRYGQRLIEQKPWLRLGNNELLSVVR